VGQGERERDTDSRTHNSVHTHDMTVRTERERDAFHVHSSRTPTVLPIRPSITGMPMVFSAANPQNKNTWG